MKTLKELKKERLKKERTKLIDLQKNYSRTDLGESTKHEIVKRIEKTNKAIANLSDIVRQEIARNANILIYGMLEAIQNNTYFRSLYYGDFEEFIEKVAGLEETVRGYERTSDTPYKIDIQKAILYFGFTKNELEILLKNDSKENSRDIFITFINKKYKTSIPTEREIEEKMIAYDDSNIVENLKNKYALEKIKLHNGEYMQGDYSYCYESELNAHYKKLIKESKNVPKRTRK